jgi:branched-chain amino acid transport system substrate-binding protein
LKLVHEISKMSDPGGKVYRPVHYIRAVCAVFYMKEAMEWADKNGGINGPNIKQGFYQKTAWVPKGLEGVCGPATWTAEDHRSHSKVPIFQASVNGPTETGEIGDLMASGVLKITKVAESDIPRKLEWLGW